MRGINSGHPAFGGTRDTGALSSPLRCWFVSLGKQRNEQKEKTHSSSCLIAWQSEIIYPDGRYYGMIPILKSSLAMQMQHASLAANPSTDPQRTQKYD
jgi:hypothetical protein